MKTVILAITAIIVLSNFSSCKEEHLEKRGLVLVSVRDGSTNKPVADATVIVYPNLEDWSDNMSTVITTQTDASGEVVLPRLTQKDGYVLDVTKGALSNWDNPSYFYVDDGEISYVPVYVTENFNTLISRVGGKSWVVNKVTSPEGKDLSDDPDYSCLIGNRETFHKSGYYEINRGLDFCNPDPSFKDGSWWNNFDYSIYIFPADPSTYEEYVIISRTSTSFVLAAVIEDEEIYIHYTLDE